MNQPAQRISLEGASQPPATDTPSLYLIDGASDCLDRSVPQQGPQNAHCLVYLVPLKRSKVRSTPERRLHLRDSLVGGSASHNAAVLAKDPHFWDYLQQINLTSYEAEIDAGRARHFINQVCGVSGRHALDHEPGIAQRYYTFVQQPFLDWLLSEVPS
jgi:hypothetical protein